VTFVWEPVPRATGERPAANSEQPARVSLMAIGPDGSPYFRGRIPDVALASAATTAASASSAGASASVAARPSRVTFEANPGKIQLRVSVEGSGSQVLDSEIREITVPDLTSSQVLLSTPEVFRARTVKDFQQIKTDPDAVPVAARDFSRTERVLIRVTAYGPGTSVPMVKARLLNRTGQAMSDLATSPPTAPGNQSQVDVPLSGLAPGEYIVEITAGAEGDAKELVGFRVTG
jgi:hypothetical protein